MEEHIRTKLTNLLRKEKIELWKPPYTTDNAEAGREPMQELANKYSQVVNLTCAEVEAALEDIRAQAIQTGKVNKTYKETQVATLELILPKEFNQETKKKHLLETKLDITTQELMKMITEKYDVQYMRLILSGRALLPDMLLHEQGVKNRSKIRVIKSSEPEGKKAMLEVEEKHRQEKEKDRQIDVSVQRTQKGFEILSERDGSEDPATTPFLEIADQKGNPIQIPDKDKKALILAMGHHEKGRALMKRKDYNTALCHLAEADAQFGKCESAMLNTVDNYAVLQLDIVWCYSAMEELNFLTDAKERLQKAEECFLKCYGEEKQRLQAIKGTTGGEEVLFLRLYLLQSLLAFINDKRNQCNEKLEKATELFNHLSLDPLKMRQMAEMGFTAKECRLALRACRGDVEQAAIRIMRRNQERNEIKEKERSKRRQRLEGMNMLFELGYSKKSAAKALNDTRGNVDEAYRLLLDSGEVNRFNSVHADQVSQTKVDQIAYLGFQRDQVELALSLVRNDEAQATEILINNNGVVPSELLPEPVASPSSEEPSTSSEGSTASGVSSLDADLVNEVLEDIPRHEEDYLDATLEEESELIKKIEDLLNSSSVPSS